MKAMKSILCVFLLVATSGSLPAQTAAPAPPAPGQTTAPAPTAPPAQTPPPVQTGQAPAPAQTAPAYNPNPNLGKAEDLLKACQKRAFHTAAFAYCPAFVKVLTGPSKSEETSGLRRLVDVTTNPQEAADAYVILRTNDALDLQDLLNQALMKNAATNPLQKQTSAPAASNGSTSLVSKSVATNLLAIAVESGALTQSQSGNTITLQANPDHLLRQTVMGNTDLSYLPNGTPILENFTVSAGLATNNPSSLTVPASGSATSTPVNTTSVLVNSAVTKLSSFTVNYEFHNKLTQRFMNGYFKKHPGDMILTSDAATAAALRQQRGAWSADLAVATPAGCGPDDYLKVAQSFQDYWASQHAVLKDEFSPFLFNGFVGAFNGCFGQILSGTKKTQTQLDNDLASYIQALQADIASAQQDLKKQIGGWDLAGQYVYNRTPGVPETHDFRLIGTGKFNSNSNAAWTLNAAGSLYASVPAGATYGRWKDAQFSGELDWNLNASSSAPSASIAGYGQYQSDPSVLNITSSSVPSGITLPANAQVFLAGTQGWLGVVQGKVTLHILGAQVPIGAKWSNRTDLLDKSKLGAQFGISYDFSQLKQLIGLGSTATP